MSLKRTLEDRLWRTGRLAGNEGLVKAYLREQIARRDEEAIHSELAEQRIGQEVAILSDSVAFRGFPASNPYMRILDMAHELGLRPADRSEGATWEAFKLLVEQLPTSARERLVEHLEASGQMAGGEALLRTYLDEEVHRRAIYPDLEREIAYDIAGIMASPAFEGVPSDNPYMQILLMAGQLELPSAHRDSGATWENLEALIRGLPTTS